MSNGHVESTVMEGPVGPRYGRCSELPVQPAAGYLLSACKYLL